jgi:predicted transcriptional regulator
MKRRNDMTTKKQWAKLDSVNSKIMKLPKGTKALCHCTLDEILVSFTDESRISPISLTDLLKEIGILEQIENCVIVWADPSAIEFVDE